MSKTDNVLSLAAEFGTMGIGLYSQVKTINSIIRDNQAYFFGYKNQSDKKIIKDNLSSIFFPNDNEWKNLVQLNIEHLYKTLIPNFLKNN